MTFAFAVILLGVLLLYCGIYGKSLRHALTGRSVEAQSGSLLQGTSVQ